MAKSSTFKFEDNSAEFLKQYRECGIAFLHEAKDSLVSQTQRNTPVKTGDLKRSFGDDSFVDEKTLSAYVGSSKEYSVWVERGTGEYAVEGNGRKGWWVYVEDNAGARKGTPKRTYTKQEALETVAYLRAKGLKAHMTCGMKPKLMLYKAYLNKKKTIARQAGVHFRRLNQK